MTSPPAPRQVNVPVVVPGLLSFVAGYLDGCTFLALYGLFVAQVTGSFVVAGAQIATGDEGVIIKVLAIPVFLLAGALTTLFAIFASRRNIFALPWALALECLLLCGFFAAGWFGAPFGEANAPLAFLASVLGLSAMGMQSALVRLMLRGVASTNVMTTNTTLIAIDAAELLVVWRDRRRSPSAATHAAFADVRGRLGGLLPLALGFVVGTAAGALAYLWIGMGCMLVAVAIMAGLALWSARLRPPA